jgi:hypothetical protein
MRIYMINDYQEDGPENIRVASSIDGIRDALAKEVLRLHNGEEYLKKISPKFEALLAVDMPCSENLGTGWGGLQFHILDTED